MTIPLNYRGDPSALPAETSSDDTAAFNARRKTGREGTIFAGGDYLFRIFPTPQRVFFIKIDTGTNQSLAITFGLLGVLIQRLFLKKKEEARTQERLASYAGKRPALLMSESKDNHILRRDEISKPLIGPPSFWTGGKFGRFTFRDAKNKKRMFFFEDAANFRAAVEVLRTAFGDELVVRARYDEGKRKIVKIKA